MSYFPVSLVWLPSEKKIPSYKYKVTSPTVSDNWNDLVLSLNNILKQGF